MPPTYPMQTTYLIRDWTEKLCRHGQDNPTFELELYEPAVVDVIYDTEDNGEDGKDIVLLKVIPRKTFVLDGGTGPFMTYRAGEECLEWLPERIVQEMRETIEIPKYEVEPEWELFA